jgi:hypothetical protein
MSDRTDISRIEGWVEIIVRDKNGKIKYHIGVPPSAKKHEKKTEKDKYEDKHNCSKNIITNVGLACIIRLVFSGLTENKFGYLAIGTGTTTESATDTALQAEIKRKSATVTQTTTSIDGDTALLEATFSRSDGLSGTSNVSEVGIFNASSNGRLLARKVFSAVPLNWDAGDSITVRYYVQLTR